MSTPSGNKKTGAGKRARKGAIAIMALLIVVVMALLFQTYMTHVLSDMKTGGKFDEVAQYNGERQAVGNLVKEAVLQYYERPRLGQAVPASLSDLVQDYLDQMQTGGTTYTVASIDAGAFPSNAATTFWPLIPNSAAAGSNTAIGTFNLRSEAAPADLVKSRAAQFFGDSNASVLEVFNSAGSGIFSVQVTRAAGGKTNATFKFYLRLFQVPVTNFNLVSYAITDKAEDIPAAPPTLGGGITLANVNALALSKMNQNGINLTGAASTTIYPYLYRELFSAAASVWEYAFYTNTAHNYIITDVMPSSQQNYFYMLSDPYTGVVSRLNPAGGSPITCSNPDLNGTYTAATSFPPTGFAPAYYYNGTLVDADGYRVTPDGGYITSSGVETGILNADNSVPTDLNGDGIINRSDASRFCPAGAYPNEIDWTFDLDKISPITISGTKAPYRYIYVHLPDTIPAGLAAHITIKDSVAGSVGAVPVIICIEGWSRANTIITNPVASIPGNYQVFLDGNLTDQQIMIYSVGVDLRLASNCSMDGVLMFDDKLGSFSRNNHTFTFRGLFAWSGKMTKPNLTPSGIAIDEDHISVAPLPAGTDNLFRSIAPRFMLVDVRSETILP